MREKGGGEKMEKKSYFVSAEGQAKRFYVTSLESIPYYLHPAKITSNPSSPSSNS